MQSTQHSCSRRERGSLIARHRSFFIAAGQKEKKSNFSKCLTFRDRKTKNSASSNLISCESFEYVWMRDKWDTICQFSPLFTFIAVKTFVNGQTHNSSRLSRYLGVAKKSDENCTVLITLIILIILIMSVIKIAFRNLNFHNWNWLEFWLIGLDQPSTF